MKSYRFLLIIFTLLLIFNSCTKDDKDDVILYDCPECEQDGIIPADEDVLPTLDVPERSDPKVIVLMYHNLVYGRTGSIYNRDIYNFENDLVYLRKNFKIIDFYDLEKINNGEMTLNNDAAIITFDDGDLSIYYLAFPLLKKYNFKATFFIVSSFVTNEVGYVKWEQLEEMVDYQNKEGIKLFSLGSHSTTHARLGEITLDEARTELSVSKEVISTTLDVPVDFVALPYGSGADVPEIQQIIKELGYKGSRTSTYNVISEFPTDMYLLPGNEIDNYSNDVFIQNMQTWLGR